MKFYIIGILFFLNFFTCSAQNQSETVSLLLEKPTTVRISGQDIRFSISLQNYKSQAVIKIAHDCITDLSWQTVRLLLPRIDGYDYDLISSAFGKMGSLPEREYIVRLSDIAQSNGTYRFKVPLIQRLSNFYEPKIISIQN
ncbi:hypothetical protein [Dyadobacter sp. CY312]|uniref:hypothetical protein n=1 Tax=Dyadobacter sp. CY312 TaxID=2907303 RepID=UPI001F3504AA|nr:hypothetical protein [Dyadobacter sp. CY312]MCE7044416.1 hypothetical protein [Dyadobacter sp. CY312]